MQKLFFTEKSFEYGAMLVLQDLHGESKKKNVSKIFFHYWIKKLFYRNGCDEIFQF